MQIEINGMIGECDSVVANALLVNVARIGQQAAELERLREQLRVSEQAGREILQSLDAQQEAHIIEGGELRAERDGLAAKLEASLEGVQDALTYGLKCREMLIRIWTSERVDMRELKNLIENLPVQ